jgi:GT2 family glycosyltransferase
VNENTPLASVIVVCWNSADVICSCLDHLLAQDYPNFEIIVVDDGSTDCTVSLAEERLGTGKLTIVQSPLNRGCPHARNLGIRQATGEFVAFVDGDGFATPSWLSRIVSEFQRDSSIGGVASTVFMDANPLALNGAGGTINRQGWAADLSMNIPYGRARLNSEALYPMGCGMAIRRSALERVGLFDDRMLNYYDDVDYGMRLWRAGYRVVVACDAWIDHGFGHSGGDSPHKQLLCEQHRMRVILKHAPLRTLPRWVTYEASALVQCAWPRRELKHKAIRWNLRQLSSTLNARRHLRGSSHVPKRLVDPSWGEGFPAGMPQLGRPNPADAKSYVDVADPEVDQVLPYGWYPTDRIHGRGYRWAGLQAAALIRLDESATTLRLDYAPAPVDLGGVDVEIRRLGSGSPLPPVWSTRLLWQYSERVIETHPVALPAGYYEMVFNSDRAWSDPPSETRSLTFALASLGFEHARELPPGGIMMSLPSASPQLVRGWYEPEAADDQTYRWSGRRAALLVRLPRGACAAQLNYRLPPGPIGGVTVAMTRLHHCRASSLTRIGWLDAHWHSDRIPLNLGPGDYLVCFDADSTWSNWNGHDPSCAPENRGLGIAVSTLSFDDCAHAEAQS